MRGSAAIDTAPRARCRACSASSTGADLVADGLGPIPHEPVPATKYDMKLTAPGGGKVFIGPHALLPADKARHVGEAVAMVVAETEAQALDAAEAVEVDYEELPFVARCRSGARAGRAGRMGRDAGQSSWSRRWFGDEAATDAAFAGARPCRHASIPRRPRDRACALEPRAALADIDAATGR